MTEDTRPEGNGGASFWEKVKKWIQKSYSATFPAGKTIGIFAVILVLTVLLTFSLTVNTYFKRDSEAVYRLRLLSELIENEAYFSHDSEKLMNGALSGYVNAMNDGYAVYLDQEAFERFSEKMSGVYVGIGVIFQLSTVELAGELRQAAEIVQVTKGSTAEAAGLLVGDYVLAVVQGTETVSIDGLTENEITSLIKGEKGTNVTLSVLRRSGNEEIVKQYTMKRASVTALSVESHVLASAEDVGVVRITGFDLQTPIQLTRTMDELIASGIQKFVIDLRNNPGGDLASVLACASYFLEPNDVVLSKESKNGDSVVYRAVKRLGSCPVSTEDIGKYRGYQYVILTNGNTASAAEILSAVFRDYSLGTLVGKTTFGKGIVQTVYALNGFGAVQFTTSVYYPPCGVSYHGVGIDPDIEVSNTETEDLQLAAALNELKK